MTKSKAERGRFSSRKKVEVVLRVLRGEDLDVVSREAGITAAKVSEWQDHFVTRGQAGLKSRAADDRHEELVRLKALVGDLTMRLELSREAVSRTGWSSAMGFARQPRCAVSSSGLRRPREKAVSADNQDPTAKTPTHTVGPEATIAERRDPQVESNMATPVSKKSGAVQH